MPNAKPSVDDSLEQDEAVVQGSEDLSPPNILLSFPVVASLVNGILASLNELRNCAAIIVGKALGEKLVTFLSKIPQALKAYRQGRPEEVLAETQLRYNELCSLLSGTFLPYVRKCFDSVFELSGNYSTLALKSKERLVSFLSIEHIQSEINSLPVYPQSIDTQQGVVGGHDSTEGIPEEGNGPEVPSNSPEEDVESPTGEELAQDDEE